MLWQLDARRAVFPVPGRPRRDGQPLGLARRWWPFRLHLPRTGAVDDGANECGRAGSEPRWQEDLRSRLAAARGISPLRCEIRAIRAVPLGALGDGFGLLS